MSEHKFDHYIINDEKLLNSLIRYEKEISTDIVSYDLETNSENEKLAKVYGIGLAFSEKRAFYIPWKGKDGIDIWPIEQQEKILLWLKSVLTTRKLIGHNIIYDVLVTENNFGFVLDNNIYADTILMKHTLEEEPPFALKEIAPPVLGQWALKGQEQLKENVLANGGKFTEDQKDMYLADTDILGEYCCFDVILTLMLFYHYDSKLKQENLDALFYIDEIMPLYKEVTINMKRQGFRIDIPYFEQLKIDLVKELNRLESEIYTDVQHHVEAFENSILEKEYPWSGTLFPKTYAEIANIPLPINKKTGKVTLAAKAIQLQKEQSPQFSELYDHILGISPRLLLDPSLARKAQEYLFFRDHPNKTKIFNLSSGDHIGHLLYNCLNISPFKFTKGNKPSTDKEVLDILLEQYKDRELWMAKLYDFKKLDKLHSTYVEGILNRQTDGFIYTSMLQFGTTSNRYASRSPNLQNLPALKDEDSGLTPLVIKYVNMIRKGFISSKGRKLISADFEQLEPSIFSHVCGDKKLQEVFHKGEDLYSSIAINSKNLSGYSADKKSDVYLGKLEKQIRKDFKAVALGIPYGAESSRVSQLMKISYSEATEVINNYMAAYPELKKWMMKSDYEAKSKGLIKTELGRIRHLPKIRSIYVLYGNSLIDYKWAKKNNIINIRREFKNGLNNAKNFQIQGMAAHVVNRSSLAIVREFKKYNIDANIILQIHDEIIVECDENQTEEAMKIIKFCMENTVRLNVPLKTNPVCAYNLAETK